MLFYSFVVFDLYFLIRCNFGHSFDNGSNFLEDFWIFETEVGDYGADAGVIHVIPSSYICCLEATERCANQKTRRILTTNFTKSFIISFIEFHDIFD